MPRLLTVVVRQPYQFLDPDRPGFRDVVRINPVRLYADIRIGQNPDTARQAFAIVDTGADLSVFPYSFWQPLAAQDASAITWLQDVEPGGCRLIPYQLPDDLPDIPDLGRVLARRCALLGGTFPAILGRVFVAVHDGFGQRLPAVPVVGLFGLDQHSRLTEPIMGMQAGILTGRKLVRRTPWEPISLAEVPPDDADDYPKDDGPANGQIWDLTI